MLKQKLEDFRRDRNCTFLGIGPMSKNCVDASIELAEQYTVPLMLIASRRQIESEKNGGGYVENWTTENFAEYVQNKDINNNIILARDHGGPWQNEVEVTQNMNLKDAMKSAKNSYATDIDSGFQLLHIDPSIDIYSKPNNDQILERVFELYEFCWAYARNKNKNISFEIGTEEQNGGNNSQKELEYTLEKMREFCNKNNIPFPTFIVVQAGTKVMETQNVGSFDSPIRVSNELPPEIQIPKMINICNRYGIFMKEHNTDYLSTESLKWQPRLGIHSANVAPEFGVAETKAFISVLKEKGHIDLLDDFLKLAYESNKWNKWILKDSKADFTKKAIIAGHYVFASDEFISIKAEASKRVSNLDYFLKNKVKESIFRYMKAFNLS